MLTGVFHGTSSEQAAQNIMREGFLVGGVDTSQITGSAVGVKNGSSFGNGVYAVSTQSAAVFGCWGGSDRLLVFGRRVDQTRRWFT